MTKSISMASTSSILEKAPKPSSGPAKEHSDQQWSAIESASQKRLSQLSWIPVEEQPSTSIILVSRIFGSYTWNALSCLLILLNSAIVINQTDIRARGETIPRWQNALGTMMLAWFVLETIGRIFAERKAYLLDAFNVAELAIVSADVALEVYSWIGADTISFAYLRLVRLARFFRVLRMLSGFRELFMMLHGMQSAMRAMLWSLVLVTVVLIMWSIIGVEFIRSWDHRLFNEGKYRADCYRCGRAFDSVWEAALTLMATVIAGDSWGAIALPMMSSHPVSAIFFCGTFMMINLGLLNLIMAVIVDRAQEARREDEEHVLQEKNKHYKEARQKLLSLCSSLDADRDGTISIQELKRGTQHSKEFSDLLRLMDIAEDDLEQLFSYLDADGSGAVTYSEFVRQLYKLKTLDAHTVLILMGERISKIYERLEVVEDTGRKLSNARTSRCSGNRISVSSVLSLDCVSSKEESVLSACSESNRRNLDRMKPCQRDSTSGSSSGAPPSRLSLNHMKPGQFEVGVSQTQENCKLWVERMQVDLDRFRHTLLLHVGLLEKASSPADFQSTMAEASLVEDGIQRPDHLCVESLAAKTHKDTKHSQLARTRVYEGENDVDVVASLAVTKQSSLADGNLGNHEAKKILVM